MILFFIHLVILIFYMSVFSFLVFKAVIAAGAPIRSAHSAAQAAFALLSFIYVNNALINL